MIRQPSSVARSPLNSQALARFHTEVRIARQVSHPNVCRVYDIGDVDGLHFLTMELVDGEDLGSLLRRIKRLPADKAVEVARQISAGLAAAHDAGILHRDLKPANVMIDGKGEPVVMDFGLAAGHRVLRGADLQPLRTQQGAQGAEHEQLYRHCLSPVGPLMGLFNNRPRPAGPFLVNRRRFDV